MRFHKTLTVLLIDLPFRVRLGIVVLAYLLCLALFALVFLPSHNGSILAIPVALSSWMLKRRGALIGLGCTLLALFVLNSLSVGGIWWPPSLLLAFLSGSLALLVEAVLISLARHAFDLAQALDLAQAAGRKAQQAEQQFALAYQHQRQLNDLKDQFILNVSHELRTPLTQVYGYLELVETYQNTLTRDKQVEYIHKAAQGCEALLPLLDTILDAARTDSDTTYPQVQELFVADLLQEVLEQFEPLQRQDHPVSLEMTEGLVVQADRHCSCQVLRNLLSNAFKYTPPHTPVQVVATRYDHFTQQPGGASQVCICVQDTGPGIPPEDIPLLFGKFVRLKRDLAGPVRGTGLGLYISKQLVEAMGGSIWVESSGVAGQGSRFCFTLRAASPASLEASTHMVLSSSLDGPSLHANGGRTEQNAPS